MASPLDALMSYKPKAGPSNPAPGGMMGEEAGADLEDQGSAGYLGPEDGPFACQHCAHFQDPNSCDKVSGVVDPSGCCNYYQSVESGNDNPGGEGAGAEPGAGLSGGIMGMLGGAKPAPMMKKPAGPPKPATLAAKKPAPPTKKLAGPPAKG